ncbi:MAG: hypothetical protein N3A38_04955 [Planctomycetota bacterium]|nr:hypothetical protein [Planctomycetota bacterium]
MARKTPPAAHGPLPPQPAGTSDAPAAQVPAPPSEPGKTPAKETTGTIPAVARDAAPPEAARKTGHVRAVRIKEREKSGILRPILIGLVIGTLVVLMYYLIADKGILDRFVKPSRPPAGSAVKR